jgi:phthalate 4,5-cis-dihydrodiol dehydrogenase
VQRLEAVAPPAVPRAEVLDELCDAVAGLRPALHTGRWGQATLGVCLAILASAREGREIALSQQGGMAAA